MLRLCIAFIALNTVFTTSYLQTAEPIYFRRDGGVTLSPHPLPDNFDNDATKIWQVDLPNGISTPCIHGDSIYLTTWSEDHEELATVAIDRAQGTIRWKQVAPVDKIESFHSVGSPASSSPACNGSQVFSFFGSYGLLCYDRHGETLWRHPLGPFQDEFGASSSPILVDNLVILNEDHDTDSFLVAIDQKTGKTVWRAPRAEFTRSYSTPAIWQNGSTKQLIVAGSLQLAAYDIVTGKKRWWVNSLSRIVDPTPSITSNRIYIATQTAGGDQTERISMGPFEDALKSLDKNGDQHIAQEELPEASPVIPRFFRIDLDQDGRLNKPEWEKHATVFERAKNIALAIKPGGEGNVTETNIDWVYRRSLPTVPSSVVYDGVMYMVKDGGIVTSLDAVTGQALKTGRARGRGNYYASLVAGDGKVFLASERGVVTILKAGPKWEILSSHDFGERILATPVFADGQIFIRTDKHLYCFAKS